MNARVAVALLLAFAAESAGAALASDLLGKMLEPGARGEGG